MKFVRLFSIFPLYCSLACAASFPCDAKIDIDFKVKPEYKITHLNKPERLIIDIQNVDDLNIINTKINKCITNVRTGVMSKNSMRLVLELNQAMSHSVITKKITNGYELNIKVTDNNKKTSNIKTKKYHDYIRAKAVSKSKNAIIIIDPGHGGHDPGAVVKNHIQEKHITLAIGKKLAKKINMLKGVEVYLTRSSDEYIPLRRRIKIAREHHADLFISIHADSNPNPNAHGVSIYALSERGATSEAARMLADKENIEHVISKKYIDDLTLNAVLIDLLQVSTVHSSLYFGKTALSKLCNMTLCHRNAVEQAGFLVLKSPNIPSVLIEVGFISNDKEAKKLTTSSYQESLTNAMLAAIKSYLNYNNKLKPVTEIIHNIKVNKGDSLYSIAKKYHTSVAKIISNNNIKNNTLIIGSDLKII
jgi:N-acetylmuramoyl-L-alanine amidase